MKKIILYFLLFNSIINYAQITGAPSKYAELDINDFKFPITNGGEFFWDLTNTTTRVPKNSGISPAFASGFWMGGYNNGNLHVAANTYRQTGIDFWPGPIGYGDSISQNSLAYDSIWEISKTTIDSFKMGLFGANIPQNILSWPGNGNSSFGESAQLAPYQDLNLNGIYEPLLAEYPIIRGDKSLFYICNDGSRHGETSGNIMGLEMHTMPYQFLCPDSAFFQTTFVHIDLYNRSQNTYNNFYFGLWNDYDLGNYNDDYIGFDSLLNLSYVYNGDNLDQNAGLTLGYGNMLASFGMLCLNQKTAVHNTYYNNTDSLSGNPNSSNSGTSYYNYLIGKRRNGSAIHYNYNSNAPVTQVILTGDPVTGTGWTETSTGLAPSDRRSISSMGPFTLLPGSKLEFDIAYVFARDYQNISNNVSPISILRNRVSSLQNYYNTQTTPCGVNWTTSIANNTNTIDKLHVYPNPFTEKVKLSGLNSTGQIIILDISGQVVRQFNFDSSNSEIDLRDLENGVYFLNFVSHEKTFVNKIVKAD